MKRNVVETLLGGVIVVIALGFGYFAYSSADIRQRDGYEVSARFESVDGLSLGSDVRIGGIKVGVVGSMELDQSRYEALVRMYIREGVNIPTDSTAAVVSDGLLGSKYVALTPGADESYVGEEGEIEYTQSSVNLETMIGKFMFSGGGVDEENTESGSSDKADEQDEKPSSSPADSLSLGL